MRINEKYQQTERCENINFDECSKYIFWCDPPMKNIKKRKYEKSI